mmetsp:Transcript_61840/g.151215  ORF Transcript_61840/g.151215 Transcript_61840/m.151215 type:complete len:86 (-) Transcript_61840:292-549(-)
MGSSSPFKGFDRRVEQGSAMSPFKERRDKTLKNLKALLDSRKGTPEGTVIDLYGFDIGTIHKTKKENKKVTRKIMNEAKECLMIA